jgi:hypothetical protein
LSRALLDFVHDNTDYHIVFFEYWLRAVRDPQLRDRLITRRRAAADQALHVFETTATMPHGPQLPGLVQLVVTISAGIAVEEVLRPGAIHPDLLADLITAVLESVPATDD